MLRQPGTSRMVVSNQMGVHDNLVPIVQKHFKCSFRRPIANHSLQSFAALQQQINADDRPIILDSCCGAGDSSRYLAVVNPDALVIGVDKSAKRLNREREGIQPANLIFVRSDLMDFYRQAVTAGWKLERHYILYPNPWPKAAHLSRRWHGSPVFPNIIKLGGVLELRSNWLTYVEEFALALKIAGFTAAPERIEMDKPLTAFEKKYHESGQSLWRLEIEF